MAWQEPKTDWKAADVVSKDDFNRIEGNTLDLRDNKVDKIAGKGLSTNDYTTAEKNKLAGIQAGAQVNTVTSVAGRTGDVILNKADVGLSDVWNYGIASKAEAEEGTSNAKYMTPLRTKQAIEAVVKSVKGNASIAETIAASETITKTIPLGGVYTKGRVFLYRSNSSNDGVCIEFTTDALEAVAYGVVSSGVGLRSRYNYSNLVHNSSQSAGSIGSRLALIDVYISGSSLILKFMNLATSDNDINVDMFWEVYK